MVEISVLQPNGDEVPTEAFVRNGANFFSLGLTDLFQPQNPKLMVAVNYGIAAVIWLVITNFVTGLVRRVG